MHHLLIISLPLTTNHYPTLYLLITVISCCNLEVVIASQSTLAPTQYFKNIMKQEHE